METVVSVHVSYVLNQDCDIYMMLVMSQTLSSKGLSLLLLILKVALCFVLEGLRYDDLLDDMYDLDIKEALSRLPQQEVDLRNQRLKRALDYSGKHTYMPKALQAKQTPYLSYLQDTLQLVKEERKEHAELGSDMPYNRAIP
jgi:ubiquinol-cytochrome c reductase subunit 7